MNYDHKKIEKKWQKIWEEQKANQAVDNSGKKFYPLVEFPYPSGEGMHVGHVRSYTAMDVIARKRRGEGFNVLYPMGWDAFGLPTENYAVKTGIHPAIVTKENTDNFRKQLKVLGLSFDWSREINTTDPKYYKWTQWIFLQLFKKGLAYKAKSMINWCPSCKIGLANEEAIGGICERCGGATEKREKEQWMLAITKYADRLDKDLDEVDYLEKIKIQQRNWIGRSEGAEIEFRIRNKELGIKVFTTRADTLFGATYLVVAPEHPIIPQLKESITNWNEMIGYVAKAAKKTEMERTAEGREKTGIELRGVKATNPATQEEIPIFVADYVLAGYGTGAIMGVPAHDERDFEFARKYDLPVKQVIMPDYSDPLHPPKSGIEEQYRQMICVLLLNQKDEVAVLDWHGEEWGKNKPITLLLGGTDGESVVDAAMREVKEETGFTDVELVTVLPFKARSRYYAAHKGINRIGDYTGVVLRLKSDARQEVDSTESARHTYRFVSLEEARTTTIGDSPRFAAWCQKMEAYIGEGILINSGDFDGLSSQEAREKITEKFGTKKVTYKLRDWVFSRQRYWGEPIPLVYCDKDGWVAIPEDQLPIELPDIKEFKPRDDGQSPLASITDWVNTKCPKCGGPAVRETDTMPNWAGSSWYYLRYTDPHNESEFASKDKLDYWVGSSHQGKTSRRAGGVDWYNGGMEHTTLHLLYSRFWHKFLFDEGLVPTNEPYAKRTSHGLILAHDGSKMSKSKGNVVNPDDLVGTFGADSLRLYEMFMGPFDQAIAWNTDGVVGIRRFLERVWRYVEHRQNGYEHSITQNRQLESLLHQTIKKVTEDIESLKMNTAVSSMMILFNSIDVEEGSKSQEFKVFLRLLAPFAPYITEELWRKIGEKHSIHTEPWPEAVESKITAESAHIVIQINGKTRDSFSMPIDSHRTAVEAFARKQVAERLAGKEIKRVIFVPNRLINFVLASG